MELENNNEQPATDSTVTDNQPKYNFNNQELSGDELFEEVKKLQKDYTQKGQELAKLKKKGEKIEDVEKKSADIEKAETIKKEEEVFNTFKSDYTSLSEHQLKSIRDLQSINPEKSFEEIANSYGMLNEAQITKAKGNRGVMGNNIALNSDKKEQYIIPEKTKRRLKLKSSEELSDIMSRNNL